MPSLFQTFYGKLSAFLLLLLGCLAVVQILLFVEYSKRYATESIQKVNWGLAANVAEQLQPALEESIDYRELSRRYFRMRIVTPLLSVYLLDAEGRILLSLTGESIEPQGTVGIEPIKSFLSTSTRGSRPIYGDDPSNRNEQAVFSAAPISIAGMPGYVYAVLSSNQGNLMARVAQESYIWRTSIFAIVGSFFVAAVLGTLLFFFLTRRLQRMTGVIEQIAEGSLAMRVPEAGDDELGRMSRSFNSMAATLEETVEKLRQTDALRRELVANVTHDLRAPLTSAYAYLETLAENSAELDEQQRRRAVRASYLSIKGLKRLVEELFELAKLQARDIIPDRKAVALDEMLEVMTLKFEDEAERREVKLIRRLEDSIPPVFADESLLDRVLSNLIDNALRFTPEGGEVLLVARACGDYAEVEVRDSGAGISEEELPHIFDRFYQSDEQPERRKGGGLGLAIVKKILDAHDTDIIVVSGEGQGTAFLFRLPFTDTALQPDAV